MAVRARFESSDESAPTLAENQRIAKLIEELESASSPPLQTPMHWLLLVRLRTSTAYSRQNSKMSFLYVAQQLQEQGS